MRRLALFGHILRFKAGLVAHNIYSPYQIHRISFFEGYGDFIKAAQVGSCRVGHVKGSI